MVGSRSVVSGLKMEFKAGLWASVGLEPILVAGLAAREKVGYRAELWVVEQAAGLEWVRIVGKQGMAVAGGTEFGHMVKLVFWSLAMEDPMVRHHKDIHGDALVADRMVQSLGAPLYPWFKSLHRILPKNLEEQGFQDLWEHLSIFYSLSASYSSPDLLQPSRARAIQSFPLE